MMQNEKITPSECMVRMLPLCITANFVGDRSGRHELAEIIRHVADVVDTESPTPEDCYHITQQLAAWCQTVLVMGGRA